MDANGTRRSEFWTGERVRLRGIEPEDWSAFAAFDLDADTQRNAWRLHPPRSAAGSRAWAEEAALSKPGPDEFRLAIESLDTEEVTGSLSVHGMNRHSGVFSYGIGLGPQFRRRGYASEAVRLMLSYMFGECRAVKCATGVYDYNAGSLALHRKLGFTEEGRLRKHVFFAGRHYDEVLFGMLAEEFAALERKAGRDPYLEARG
jgi:RimJ/RimL family protein N-acetyltransferase